MNECVENYEHLILEINLLHPIQSNVLKSNYVNLKAGTRILLKVTLCSYFHSEVELTLYFKRLTVKMMFDQQLILENVKDKTINLPKI
jgi:hypothetical protein